MKNATPTTFGDHDKGNWQKGPLPPNTWNWGGAVPVGMEDQYGFYFADFRGKDVKLVGCGKSWNLQVGKVEGDDVVLQPHEVAYYDNSLTVREPTK